MAQAALCDITPQTRIPTLLIVFCVHVLLLVGRCEFRPNLQLRSTSMHAFLFVLPYIWREGMGFLICGPRFKGPLRFFRRCSMLTDSTF